MKRVFKQSLSIFLAVIMVFGSVPLAEIIPADLNLDFGLEFDFDTSFLSEFKNSLSLKVKAASEIITSQDGKFNYTLDDNGYATIVEFLDNTATEAVIGDVDGCTVIAIGANAFKGNNTLESVVLSETITTIGDNAFYNCTSLATVDLNNVKTIGNYAFYNCTSLATVDLNNVKTIGECAFWNTALTTILIPNTLTSITAEYIYDDSSYYYYGPFANTGVTTVVFEEGMATITNNILAGCKKLIEVTIPDTVEKIGDSAFLRCISLEEIDLPESLKTVGNNAFSNCTVLKGVVLPDSVTTIGNYAFYNCTSLATVDLNNVKTIGECAFWNTALTTILIPNTLTSITAEYIYDDSSYYYYGPFANTGVTTVVFEEGMATITNNILAGCKKLIEVTIPDTVEKIGDSAFLRCISLEEIDLPESLKTVGNNAFSNCTVLKGVVLPDSVTTIGNYAFYNCTSLVTVDLNNVKTIGECAFWNTALTTILIPNTLTSITAEYIYDDSSYYYYGPFANTGVTTVVFEEGMATITNNILAGCKKLIEVTIPDTVEKIGDSAFLRCISLEEIDLPESLKTVGNYAFSNCTVLKGVVLPDSVTTIGDNAFYNCTSLATVDLNNVKTIGNYAFYNCTSLATVDLNNVKTIGECAFWNTALTTILIPNTLTSITAEYIYDDSSYYYYGPFANTGVTTVVFEEGMATITNNILAGCKKLIEVTIPDTVEKIGDSAFLRCISLEEIDLPESLKTVGNNAFSNCTVLKGVVLPDSVTTIGNYAFYNCTSLATVDLNNVKTIGECAFWNTALTTILIPNTLTSITAEYIYDDSSYYYYGPFANTGVTTVVFEEGMATITNNILAGCKKLIEVTIPDTVEKIGDSAFLRCISLEEIDLPESLKTVGNYAFSNCTVLKGVVLPDSVTSIGNNTFYNCTSLESIKLFDSVTSIGNNTFYNCTSLESITLPDSVTSIGSNAFTTNNPNFSIKINNEDSDVVIALIDNETQYTAKRTGINDAENRYLDRAKTSYYSTSSNLSLSNSLNLVVNYDFKDAVKKDVTVSAIRIKLPSSVDFLGAKINGNAVNNAPNNRGFLTLKPTTTSGKITLSVRVSDTSYLSSYAQIDYKLNGETKTETIGIVNINDNLLTISAPAQTSSSSIEVKGLAIAGDEVKIFVDGVEQNTTIARNTGSYSSTVTLNNCTDGKEYLIEARVGDKTASTKVVYEDDAVSITSAKMIYRGNEYDLLKSEGKLPVISWAYNTSFSFVVKVDKPNNVRQLYISDTKSQKNLLLKYDETIGGFIGTGFKNIVPDMFKITCITDSNMHEIAANVNLEKINVATIPQIDISKFKDEIVENTLLTDPENGKIEYKCRIPDSDKDLTFIVGNIPIDDIRAEDIINNPEYEKRPINEYVDGYAKTICSANDEIIEIVYYIHGNEVIKGTMKRISGVAKVFSYGSEILGGDGIFIPTDVKSFGEYFAKQMVKNSNLDVLVFHLISDAWTSMDDLIAYSSSIGGLFGNFAVNVFKLCFFEYDDPAERRTDIVMSVLYAAGFVVSLCFPQIALPLTLVLGLLEILPILDELGLFDGMFKFAIDPSGYVYEAVPSNRLEGVTATIYYSKYETGEGAVVWDAGEYDQVNPLITYEDGSYMWDVPEGYWQVKYEKDGYETAYSEWMYVPPERTDVNIALNSTLAPEIEYAAAYSDGVEIGFSQFMDVSSINKSNISINGATNFDVQAIDAEDNGNGTQFAKKFFLKSKSILSKTAKITVSCVKNYCGKQLASAYNKTFNVIDRVEKLEVKESVYVDSGETTKVVVSALPVAAAKGRTATVKLSGNFDENDSFIARVTESITFDASGKAYIEINTQLPGDVKVTVSLDNSNIETSFDLYVVSDITNIPHEHTPSDWKVNNENHTMYKECTECGEILETKNITVATTKLTSCYNEVKGVQLKWNAVNGAKSYKVYRKLPSQTEWVEIKSTTALEYQDINVTGNTVYQYSVKAVDQYGNESDYSPQRECRFIETPTLLSRTNAVGGVTIKWKKVAGATSYRIYRRGAGVNYWYYLGDFPATLDTFTDLETANYFPDDAQKNALAKPKSGNYYRYTVRASYDGEDSTGKDYLIYSGFDTNGLYLKYVATPKLTSISNATNGLQIKWNAVAGGGPVEYRVYRRGAGSTYWYYLGTTTNTTWTDSGVKVANGGYYRYTVRAVAGTNGKGWYSAFDTTGLYLMRLANPTLTSAVSSIAGITVKWSAIKGTTGYYVYRKTANSGWTRIAAVGGTNNTTFLDKTAKKGTTYTYTVKAVYGATTSAYNAGISCYDKY